MKKNILFLLFAFLICSLHAQKELILQGNQAHEKISGTELIRIKPQSSIPAYIRFYQGQEISPQQADLFFQKIILPSEKHRLKETKQETDPLGYQHIRYRQFVETYPVEGSMYSAHIRAGKVYAFHGDLFDKIPENRTPSISENQAFESALAYVDASVYMWERENYSGLTELDYLYQRPKGKLVFAPMNGDFQKGEFRLAYKFDIYARQPLSRTFTYVDAQSGEVIWQVNQLHTSDVPGTAETKYSGVQNITTDSTSQGYRLREAGRGNGIWTLNLQEEDQANFAVDFWDEDNYWNNVNENHDEVATDAHFGAEKTYDFYLETFGRNSIDGEGFRLTSMVHFGENIFNAFWDGNIAGFGDGNNGNALTSIDIVAHEFTHGLTDFTAGLIYQNESGALNESFSDIFGVAVERFAKPQDWNWIIGDEIGSPLRSMSNPNRFNNPRNYQGNNWFTGTGDNGGVHSNSGVQNHWFYLLVEGGSGTNDFGNVYDVSALGFEKASQITYRNLTVYMTPSSQYADARFYANLSASEIFGACTPEVEATTNAWYAVGVGDIYEPKAISGFQASPLENCVAPFSINFQNRSQNASDFIWDFGDGNTSTEANPMHTYVDSGMYSVELIASGGACGTDTTKIADLINISGLNVCRLSPDLAVIDNCKGNLVDDGGNANDYSDRENYVVTIAPPEAYKINLQFTDFDYEDGFDYLIVYDGPDTNSNVIGRYTGSDLPNQGEIIRSLGNSITIQHKSDPFVTGRGFELNWSCSLPLPPEAAFTALDSTNCSGYVRFMDESFQAEAWLWDFGDGTQSTEQNPLHFYEEEGTYTVELITVNEFGISSENKVDFIVIGGVDDPVVEDVELCEDNGTTLSVEGTEGGSFNWYNADSVLIQANTSSLQVLVGAGTTTYLVEQEFSAEKTSVGPASINFGTGSILNTNNPLYLTFNAYQELTIDSVWVNSGVRGTRNIRLWDNSGQTIDFRTVNMEVGWQQIALNFTIPAGLGYRLGGSSMSLYRNNSGAEYPYISDNGILEIIGSSAGSTYYYYMYNWTVSGTACKSKLVPIQIERSEGPRPEANFDYNLENGQLVFQDLSLNADAWFWDFGNGSTSNEQNPTHQYQNDGEYRVRLIVFNQAAICNDTIEQTIKVSGITSLENELGGASVKLFPNPGNGTFELQIHHDVVSDIEVAVFNPLGQKVYQSPLHRSTQIIERLNLSGFSPTTYLVRIRVNNRVAFRKYILR